MTVRPRNVNSAPYTSLVQRATEIVPQANKLIVLVQAVPDSPGFLPIRNFLLRRNQVLLRDGVPVGNPLNVLRTSTGKAYLLDAPFPMTPTDAIVAAGVPPQFVTHVVMILPGDGGLYDLYTNDPAFDKRVYDAAPTAFAFGNIARFDPESKGVEFFDALGNRTRRLVNFVESRYERPVLYIATSQTTGIDRTPRKV